MARDENRGRGERGRECRDQRENRARKVREREGVSSIEKTVEFREEGMWRRGERAWYVRNQGDREDRGQREK